MSQVGKRIVIGIPSYNEEDTIGFVVKQVDLGLRRFYPSSDNLIINVDSDSNDNTKDAFLKTPTFHSKKYFNTGKKMRGKGKNLIELFKYCNNSGVDFIVLIDSDIKTVKPRWIFSLLNPLIREKFDYTTPVYSRGCYDGNVTNNFAYPLTYAVFGVDLQQPIGGEFALNKRLYRYLLKQPISDAVLGFGIDIFMTYHAIGGGFKICEAYLGRKKHKPGFSTLTNKFIQFSQSAIEVTKAYRNKLDKVEPIKSHKSIHVFKTKKKPGQKLVIIQLNQYRQEFKNNMARYIEYLGRELTDEIVQKMIEDNKPMLSSTVWIEALSKFLNICYEEKFDKRLIPQTCHMIESIFYWRAISFWEEMKPLSPKEIDGEIRNQANLLRKKIITK